MISVRKRKEKETKQMDNNWCDYCGKSRKDAIVEWYLFEGEEFAFCNRHAKEMGLTRNDLLSM